jgi:hypothetical protein
MLQILESTILELFFSLNKSDIVSALGNKFKPLTVPSVLDTNFMDDFNPLFASFNRFFLCHQCRPRSAGSAKSTFPFGLTEKLTGPYEIFRVVLVISYKGLFQNPLKCPLAYLYQSIANSRLLLFHYRSVYVHILNGKFESLFFSSYKLEGVKKITKQ